LFVNELQPSQLNEKKEPNLQHMEKVHEFLGNALTGSVYAVCTKRLFDIAGGTQLPQDDPEPSQ
jgi:hypothetical protein